jgi:hypothetical protein
MNSSNIRHANHSALQFCSGKFAGVNRLAAMNLPALCTVTNGRSTRSGKNHPALAPVEFPMTSALPALPALPEFADT